MTCHEPPPETPWQRITLHFRCIARHAAGITREIPNLHNPMKFPFLKSNWRELVALILGLMLLLVGMLALGTREVSESGSASMGVSLLVTLIGGAVKFSACLALAWGGLLVTFPEANKFIVGDVFDRFWECCPTNVKGYIALAAAAVLGIVAALCMASS